MTTTIKVSNELRDRLKTQARRRGRTLSQHLAELADAEDSRAPFVQQTSVMSARVDIGNIGEVLAALDRDEWPEHRSGG